MDNELQWEYEAVNVLNAMKRLIDNEDFKRIFMDGYMKEDLVQLGLNVANVPLERRKFLEEQMLARGVFRQYIDGIITSGLEAEKAINEAEQEGEE